MATMGGSYLPSEVSLLLSDSEAAKYLDYVPEGEYHSRLREYVLASAGEVAVLVGLLAEKVLRQRGSDLVLVSIARAGTPVGILVKRWLSAKQRIDLPHFTISIASGSVDEQALSWLLRRFEPHRLQFIDGWTSTGTVARLLRETCARDRWRGVDPKLAVLVDPCGVADASATYADVLLPHACLGAQMSGLLGPPHGHSGDPEVGFHRVDVRRELQGGDLTRWYLERVIAKYDDAEIAVAKAKETRPDGDGVARLRQVARLAEEFGLGRGDPINVGLSEAARALFRPCPRRLVVRRRGGVGELLCDVAEQRGVTIDVNAHLLVEAVAV